jgi:hypothetical protein
MQGGGGGGFPGGGGVTPQPTGPFSVPVQTVEANYIRTTEDRAGGNSFTIRDKVTGGTIVAGNGASARLEDVYEFKSRYRTVSSSGDVLRYALATKPGAYVALPMIDLGGGRRRVGQRWQTRVPILLEWATLDAPPTVRATNVLEGLEWQDGYQTARIRQTYQGKADIPIYGGAGKMRGANVEMERVIWFGYRPGRIIRMETTVQVSGDAPANILSAMVPSAGINATGGFGGGGGFPGGGGYPGGGIPGGGGYPGGGLGLGSSSGGFGALQQGNQEAPRAPAKFRSVTTVRLGARPAGV